MYHNLIEYEQTKLCRVQHHVFEDYLVSSNGCVFSKKTGKMLKQYVDGDGYSIVKLYLPAYGKNKKNIKTLMVHRLVMYSFFNEKMNDTSETIVDHINVCVLRHVAKNNSLHNLRWVTHRDNSQHKRCRKHVINTTLKYRGKHPFLYRDEEFIKPAPSLFSRHFQQFVRVTNHGRIYRLSTMAFTRGHLHKNKYRKICIDNITFKIHRFIYRFAFGRLKKNEIVCHKDSHPMTVFPDDQSYTNFLDTLRIDTQSNNMIEYHKQKKLRWSKKTSPNNNPNAISIFWTQHSQPTAQTTIPQRVPKPPPP